MLDNSSGTGSTALAEPPNDRQPEAVASRVEAPAQAPRVPVPGTTIPIEQASPENTYAQYYSMPQQIPQQTYIYPATEDRRGTQTALWAVFGVLLAIIIFGVVLALAAFPISDRLVGNTSTVGNLTTDTSSIPIGAVTSADVNLDMNVGNIKVVGSTSNLVEGTFTYNVPAWKPQIGYATSGGNGVYEVRQPKNNLNLRGNMRNEWNLKLSDSVPTSVKINLGVGDVNADLRGLSLKSLDINNHTGNTTVDLSGDWQNSLTAKITGDVGNTTLRVPSGVGVRVVAHKDLGNITVNGLKAEGNVYTNDLYGKSGPTLDIDATVRLGNLVVETVK